MKSDELLRVLTGAMSMIWSNKISDNLKQELSLLHFHIVIPDDMPLVIIDFGLIEQVLHNLVLNATQNAPAGTNIQAQIHFMTMEHLPSR